MTSSLEDVGFPRVLVVSNNAFSDTSNNGKTLSSFFEKFPQDRVAQLYFSQESPSGVVFSKFFQVTDRDVLKSCLSRNAACGRAIDLNLEEMDIKKSEEKGGQTSNLFRSSLFRIIRELIWNHGKWITAELNQWLDGFSPEVVFLCGGDSGFAYNVAEYVKQRYQAKSIVYITDDYILPRKFKSVVWWIRRNYILKKMKYAVQNSDLFITISQKMSDTYRLLFGKESIVVVNMTMSMKEEKHNCEDRRSLTLVYTGGLHFKRYQTLKLLAQAIRKYNLETNGTSQAKLKIFSNQRPSDKILKLINLDGASEFKGSLNREELVCELNSCDIPVHVESFSRKSIESTRLSLSTKIPEYLSLGKPILAIGPGKIASMEYLAGSAYCITERKALFPMLKAFLDDNDLRKKYAEMASDKYLRNHDSESVRERLLTSIRSIC